MDKRRRFARPQQGSRIQSKYSDLYESIALLEPGDPPLRWKIDCMGKGSRYNLKQVLHNRFPDELHIFIHNWEFWIIKLTPLTHTPMSVSEKLMETMVNTEMLVPKEE